VVGREALERAKYLLLPWSGMLGAGIGWAFAHQLGSDFVQDDCRAANPVLMILIGLIGIAIIAFGGMVSWRAREREDGARKFLAYVGALMAALFAVALFMQTSATFFLPRCFG
jgi:di/tricarboxylate transporter